MYEVVWLILWVLLALAGGVAIGVAVTRATSHRTADRVRELEDQLTRTRRELDEYRKSVIDQFGTTARKFQSLNDAYTDLHLQLARSSSILCGEGNGPLLAAPRGHQDLLSAESDEPGATDDDAVESAAEPEAAALEESAAR